MRSAYRVYRVHGNFVCAVSVVRIVSIVCIGYIVRSVCIVCVLKIERRLSSGYRVCIERRAFRVYRLRRAHSAYCNHSAYMPSCE